MFDWLKRWPECGSPCQRCANECPVAAIHPKGVINVHECIYCLDCQKLYYDDHKCPHVIQLRLKRERRLALASEAMLPEAMRRTRVGAPHDRAMAMKRYRSSVLDRGQGRRGRGVVLLPVARRKLEATEGEADDRPDRTESATIAAPFSRARPRRPGWSVPVPSPASAGSAP